MIAELSVVWSQQRFCSKQTNPLGFPIQVVLGEHGITSIHLGAESTLFPTCQPSASSPPKSLIEAICCQLHEYCVGSRHTFILPFTMSHHSLFSQRVYHVVSAIPYGHTMTYGEVAAQLGLPRAAQAVGRALAHNPVPIIIPCHRVIGRDGWIGGYSCGDGVATKRVLLEHETKTLV